MNPTALSTDAFQSPGLFLGSLAFLVCGMPEKERRKRLLLVIVAHIDDSGSNGKDTPVMVLAGYLARAESWQTFSEKWKAALNGPPKIERFHAVEAYRLQDNFKHISKEYRDDLIASLSEIIAEHAPTGIASVLHWDHFRHFKSGFTHPLDAYRVMFFRTIWSVLELTNKSFPGEQVEIVFDDQGTLGTQAASLHDWAALSLSKKMRGILAGRPVHRSSKYVLPLQAADLLAWNVRRASQADGINISAIPPVLRKDLLLYKMDGTYFDKRYADVLEMDRRFPGIASIYSKAELIAIRNRFLGYDPDCEE